MKTKKAEQKSGLVLAACGVIWGDGEGHRIKRLGVKKNGTFGVLSKFIFVEEEEGPGVCKHTVHYPPQSPSVLQKAV